MAPHDSDLAFPVTPAADDPWRPLRDAAVTLPADTAPCRAEGLRLIALADAITTARPAFGRAFVEWRRQMDEALADPSLETLDGEARLERLATALRRLWLRIAHSIADEPMKSPPYLDTVALPFQPSSYYVYERVASPRPLELRGDRRYPPALGWETRVLMFSCAMGALTTLMQVLPRHFRVPDQAARWDALAGYFETHQLLRLHAGRGAYFRLVSGQSELFERVAAGKTDILFAEPTLYDWEQTILDPAGLVEAIRARPLDRPLALVLDSTLLGTAFRMDALLRVLGPACPLLAVEVRSGLKLDQEGLELSNVGILRLFTRESETAVAPAERWRRRLRDARKVLGNALSLDEMAVLDVPWFSDPARMDGFQTAVLANNARLARTLAQVTGTLFGRVHHPCLSPQAGWQWAKSPFVNLELRDDEDNRAAQDLTEAVIFHEARQRGLTVIYGASFGFRHHRFEFIRPFGMERSDGRPRGFLKIAMGRRWGPSADGLTALLQEIATYPDIAALRRAYPDLAPLRPE